jgi:hypothetical protein
MRKEKGVKKGAKSGLESCCTGYAMSFSSKVSQRRGGKSPLGASLKPAMSGDASTRFKMRSDPCRYRYPTGGGV